MNLIATIDGEQVEARVSSDGSEVAVEIDGVETEIDCVEVEPGVYSLIIDGRHIELSADGDEEVTLSSRAGEITISIEDPRRLSRQAGTGGASGPSTLSSPMPGKIVEVLVAEGDSVEEGQGVLVMEAMKMQNEVKAPRDGVVQGISVAAGESVGAGQTLAVIE